ncbi:GNAT family N-acetyltransferase [Balneolaceae bacterium ANBcel3]|nr:GNAT family N-acetyltransferase [Balneolaceae bacterium ANBcel3]
MLHSSPAGTYGGWLTEDGSILDTEETAFLLKTLFEASETLVLRLSPFLILEQKNDSGPFTNVSGAGISCIPDQTYILDTRIGLEALEKRWKKKLGRKLKKAETSGVCIHRTDQNTDIERFYTLYKSCIETWNPPPGHIYPPEFIATLLKDTGSADLWIAEYENKVIAGAIVARGINHWAYWLGATDRNYSHLRAANLLHTQIIITQCNEGVQWYDFNPSAGLKGVEQFKASFGATKKAAPLFIKKRPFFHFLEKSSTLVKRFTSSILPT